MHINHETNLLKQQNKREFITIRNEKASNKEKYYK